MRRFKTMNEDQRGAGGSEGRPGGRGRGRGGRGMGPGGPGGPGQGRGGRGRGPGGPGGGGWRGAPFGWWDAPRARRGDVRTAVLTVLADEDAHGYQVIQEIAGRT